MRIRTVLRIAICTAVGCSIGRSLYVCWHYIKYPELYAMQSAPWYTPILLSGMLAGVITLAASVAYVIIGIQMKKTESVKEDEHGKN